MGEQRDHILSNGNPKWHPEIFGEVIEYSWGYANNYYTQFSLYQKKGDIFSKQFPRGHIKRQPYHKEGLYVF